MRKIICFLLIVLMLFCLCSCAVHQEGVQYVDTLSSDSNIHFWVDE